MGMRCAPCAPAPRTCAACHAPRATCRSAPHLAHTPHAPRRRHALPSRGSKVRTALHSAEARAGLCAGRASHCSVRARRVSRVSEEQ
eukprot:1970464-Prymnesium_polylepis.1